MIYMWRGRYQIFTDYFLIKFVNWDKGTGSLRLLLWWDLAIGWLRIRKHKTTVEMSEALKVYRSREHEF